MTSDPKESAEDEMENLRKAIKNIVWGIQSGRSPYDSYWDCIITQLKKKDSI